MTDEGVSFANRAMEFLRHSHFVLRVPLRTLRFFSFGLRRTTFAIAAGPFEDSLVLETRLFDNQQETVWVNVSAPGYVSVQVDLPPSWPLRVTLDTP